MQRVYRAWEEGTWIVRAFSWIVSNFFESNFSLSILCVAHTYVYVLLYGWVRHSLDRMKNRKIIKWLMKISFFFDIAKSMSCAMYAISRSILVEPLTFILCSLIMHQSRIFVPIVKKLSVIDLVKNVCDAVREELNHKICHLFDRFYHISHTSSIDAIQSGKRRRNCKVWQISARYLGWTMDITTIYMKFSLGPNRNSFALIELVMRAPATGGSKDKC